MNEIPCKTCISLAICHMRHVFKCEILVDWIVPIPRHNFSDRRDLYTHCADKLDQMETLFSKKVFGINPATKTVILSSKSCEINLVSTEMVEDL